MKVLVTVAMLLAVATANAQTTTPDTPKTAAPAQQKQALDHGPRATSTPWLNKQIREHQAARRAPAAAQARVADTAGTH